MSNELGFVEQLSNAVQNTSPVTAFFMGAASVFIALNKRLFVTNEMAKLREENAGFKAKIEFLESHITDLESRLDKLEARRTRT